MSALEYIPLQLLTLFSMDPEYIGAYVTSVPSMTMATTPAVSTIRSAVVSTVTPAVVSTIVPAATTILPGASTTVVGGSTVVTAMSTDSPPYLAAAFYNSYILSRSAISSASADAAAASKALKLDKHNVGDTLEKACDDDDECEKQVEKALKGKWPNAADNLQVQLTTLAVGLAALGGAFVLI